MKEIRYTCDRCGKEIKDTLYTLTCYAENVQPDFLGRVSTEVAVQNMRQNMAQAERHLCKACKDELTDGVFIV